MRPHGLGPSATRVSTLAVESGNVFNLQDFEQNDVPFKQRSFEDSIDTFFNLFDADLLLIWMNNFRHGFRSRSASCPVLHIVLIISRGECIYQLLSNTHRYPIGGFDVKYQILDERDFIISVNDLKTYNDKAYLLHLLLDFNKMHISKTLCPSFKSKEISGNLQTYAPQPMPTLRTVKICEPIVNLKF